VWTDNTMRDAEAERLGVLASELGLSGDAAADIEREVMDDTKEAILERQEHAAREKVRKERYREAVEEAWTDQKVSSEEAERLGDRGGELGLSTDAAADIEREIMGEIKEVLVEREEPSNNQKAALLYKQGLQYLDNKEWTQALQTFKKVCQLQPDLAEAWSNKGLALTNMRRSLEALEAYEKAISLKPDLAEAWSNKGVALMNMRRYHEALEAYDKAIGLKPQLTVARKNRDIALRALRGSGQSKGFLRRLIEG